jgi:hypothetical protein
VYRHSFAKNSAGVEQWDKEKEWYNGDKNDPATLPQFTYEEYLQYLDPDSGQDPAAVMGLVDGPVTEKLYKNEIRRPTNGISNLPEPY